MSDWSRWIDLDAYPLADGANDAPIDEPLRGTFAEQGWMAFPDFLTPSACAALLDEVRALLPVAHARDIRLQAYSESVRQDVPQAMSHDVPEDRRHRFCMKAIGYDQFPADSLLTRLFEWDRLTGWIRRLVGLDSLFRCADPLLSCVVTAMTEGGEHGWHFDDNDIVASLLLQRPAGGGHYELVPEAIDAPDVVARVMDGDRASVVTPEMNVGTLVISSGRRALHRVSPITEGERLIALFSYDRQAGMQFPEVIRRNVLGRATARQRASS